MGIVERLRKIAKEEGYESVLDESIELLDREYNLKYSESNKNQYAAAVTYMYEYKKKQIQQYIEH